MAFGCQVAVGPVFSLGLAWDFLRISLSLCIFAKNSAEVMLNPHGVLSGPARCPQVLLLVMVNLGHLVKTVPVGFLHCKIVRFPSVINEYLGGDTLGKKEKGCPSTLGHEVHSCAGVGDYGPVYFLFLNAVSGTPCISAFAFFLVFHLGEPLDYTLVTQDGCAGTFPSSSPAPPPHPPHAPPTPPDILCFLFVIEVVLGEGNGSPLQCSRMENPRDRGTWWAAVYGVARSGTGRQRLSSSRTCFYQGFFLAVLKLMADASGLPCGQANVRARSTPP